MAAKNWNYRHLQEILYAIPIAEFSAPWESTRCIEWDKGRHRQGYGTLRIDGKYTLAHIAAYQEVNGPTAHGLMVLHHCDNPPCFHPGHLYSGTQTDNMRDRSIRGRCNHSNQKGAKNNQAKLTDADVHRILGMIQSGKPIKEIAYLFSVSAATIYLIANGERWAHIGVNIEDV